MDKKETQAEKILMSHLIDGTVEICLSHWSIKRQKIRKKSKETIEDGLTIRSADPKLESLITNQTQ